MSRTAPGRVTVASNTLAPTSYETPPKSYERDQPGLR